MGRNNLNYKWLIVVAVVILFTGTKGSLSEAGTSPPHNLDTPHVPVDRITTATTINHL